MSIAEDRIVKIRDASDLRAEFGHHTPLAIPSIAEDLVVLAGGIGMGTEVNVWAS
ncbi:hypothetical protein KHP57_15695 [Algiphilus sp. NNCM1]|nr:hypothetical protein [Algiphilus acroporae]MCI5061891.1 hypothetical protein [Algiphilus sp.]